MLADVGPWVAITVVGLVDGKPLTLGELLGVAEGCGTSTGDRVVELSRAGVDSVWSCTEFIVDKKVSNNVSLIADIEFVIEGRPNKLDRCTSSQNCEIVGLIVGLFASSLHVACVFIHEFNSWRVRLLTQHVL